MSNFAFVQAVGRPETYAYRQITENGMNVTPAPP